MKYKTEFCHITKEGCRGKTDFLPPNFRTQSRFKQAAGRRCCWAGQGLGRLQRWCVCGGRTGSWDPEWTTRKGAEPPGETAERYWSPEQGEVQKLN